MLYLWNLKTTLLGKQTYALETDSTCMRNGQVLHHVIGIAYDRGAAILCEVKSKF